MVDRTAHIHKDADAHGWSITYGSETRIFRGLGMDLDHISDELVALVFAYLRAGNERLASTSSFARILPEARAFNARRESSR